MPIAEVYKADVLFKALFYDLMLQVHDIQSLRVRRTAEAIAIPGIFYNLKFQHINKIIVLLQTIYKFV